jgi:hypothetical protein
MITDAICAAAQAYLDDHKLIGANYHRKLKAIVGGERKFIDAEWWRSLHGLDSRQVIEAAKAKDRKRLKALEEMAVIGEATSNASDTEKETALKQIANLKANPSKAAKPRSAPGLEEHDRQQAAYREACDRVNKEAFARMGEMIAAKRATAAKKATDAFNRRHTKPAREASNASNKPSLPRTESPGGPSSESNRAKKAAPQPSNISNEAELRAIIADQQREIESLKADLAAARAYNASNAASSSNASNRSGPVRASRESFNAYQREYMRRWRAARKAKP